MIWALEDIVRLRARAVALRNTRGVASQMRSNIDDDPPSVAYATPTKALLDRFQHLEENLHCLNTFCKGIFQKTGRMKAIYLGIVGGKRFSRVSLK